MPHTIILYSHFPNFEIIIHNKIFVEYKISTFSHKFKNFKYPKGKNILKPIFFRNLNNKILKIIYR